jgi:hypothetical protein
MPAHAQGEHPNYLHSRSDLRMAEALLRYTDEPGVMHKLERAAENIHRAIGDLDLAIAIDHKGELENPPIDVPKLGRTGRFTEIERLLNGSLKNLDLPESRRAAREPRRSAEEHIRNALMDVAEAKAEFHEDHVVVEPPHLDRHPHYMHALTDLRYARALLDRHGEREWSRERERFGAVEEIDHSIAELKRAAIDDGKDLNDHPMVDYTVHQHERLVKVLELLNSSMKSLDYEEDDQASLGWRDAARHHIAEARRMVEIAMRD